MDDDVFTRLQLGLLLGLVTTPTALAWMCCCTGKCYRRGGPPEGAEGRHFPSNARACRLGSLGSDPHQVEGTHRREKGTSLAPQGEGHQVEHRQKSHKTKFGEQELDPTGHGTQSSAHHERIGSSSSGLASSSRTSGGRSASDGRKKVLLHEVHGLSLLDFVRPGRVRSPAPKEEAVKLSASNQHRQLKEVFDSGGQVQEEILRQFCRKVKKLQTE